MNNTLEEINRRITEAKEQVSGLEDRTVQITTAEQNIEKWKEKKNEDSQREDWDNIKHINVHIIVVPEEEREKGPEKIFEK